MYARAHRLLGKSALLRYIVVGGASYAIELSCIYIIRLVTGSDLFAVGVSFWIGLIVSFLMQKVIAFKNTANTRRQLAWQTAAYILLVCVNYIFTLWFSWAFSPVIGIFIARTGALVITTAWNYFAYKHIIFKHSH